MLTMGWWRTRIVSLHRGVSRYEIPASHYFRPRRRHGIAKPQRHRSLGAGKVELPVAAAKVDHRVNSGSRSRSGERVARVHSSRVLGLRKADLRQVSEG
jgi:hypothetical protein